MKQSELLAIAITLHLLKARQRSRIKGATGFGFASQWLKNWRKIFKPLTKYSNHNLVNAFDSHVTALV